MEELQHEPRVGKDDSAERSEESRGQETSTVFVTRLLANPRRVRRD